MSEFHAVDLISDGRIEIGVFRRESDNSYFMGVKKNNRVKLYGRFDDVMQSCDFMDFLADFVNARNGKV